MGMVTAAAATEHLIDRHQPSVVLNFGCAGGHRRDIMPGDVVIASRVVNHTALQILPSGEDRYVGFGWEVAGEKAEKTAIIADPDLLTIARRAAEGYEPVPWPGNLFWPPTVTYRRPIVHEGTVVSADIWTQNIERLDVLHGRHDSLCEDMETAAVAQVSAMHGVPFLSIKDISNNEFHRASDIASFGDFPTEEVGRRAAGLTLRILEELARRK
jgi:adenosylhomocysteine nucleosidase